MLPVLTLSCLALRVLGYLSVIAHRGALGTFICMQPWAVEKRLVDGSPASRALPDRFSSRRQRSRLKSYEGPELNSCTILFGHGSPGPSISPHARPWVPRTIHTPSVASMPSHLRCCLDPISLTPVFNSLCCLWRFWLASYRPLC